ncbi:universal stress protein [Legionella spiritensis]|uniref:Universal stress protein n=1 Tax=Legionella spiritensis TaxID=452 RepID=A0A0W0YY10_LEGSP|nr:universal stress protein [Legionella spiritensis]KTD61786.1 universal stress protein A [Legionella spiritensis]SNV38447.1 universal stress protein A [Legionella spiritensis]
MYTNILHATDLKENHFRTCEQAADIASRFGATLHLLHVIEPPASLQLAQGLGFAELATPVKDDAKTVMNVLGDALNIPVERQHVEVGSVKLIILSKVRELDCDLIIIGSHAPNHLPAFLGSTANAIVHHATCDVLTLRTK